MTECNRCGDCCENLQLNFTKAELRAFVRETADHASTPVRRDHLANARFILAHWHRAGGGGSATRYACDAFDPVDPVVHGPPGPPTHLRGLPLVRRAPGVEDHHAARAVLVQRRRGCAGAGPGAQRRDQARIRLKA